MRIWTKNNVRHLGHRSGVESVVVDYWVRHMIGRLRLLGRLVAQVGWLVFTKYCIVRAAL